MIKGSGSISLTNGSGSATLLFSDTSQRQYFPVQLFEDPSKARFMNHSMGGGGVRYRATLQGKKSSKNFFGG
jgi:hypothetical protein